MEELDFKRVGPPRKSFTPAAKLTHAEIVAFKAAIFEAEPEGVEYISNLEAENAALKEELKAINAALDDPRTDLTMTACQVIAALKKAADRYRWLRENPTWIGYDSDYRADEVDAVIDAVIDAAMKPPNA